MKEEKQDIGPVYGTPEDQDPATLKVIGKNLHWVFVPLAVLLIFELCFRTSLYSISFGWQTAEEEAGRNKISYVFIGTSRTAAGIDSELFTEIMTDRLDRWIYGQNHGAGGVRIINHYMGLRNLILEKPEKMRGSTVFIEAPGGLPEYMYYTDEWTHPTYEMLIAPNMRWEDVPDLMQSEMTLSEKAGAVIRMVFYPWRTFARKYAIREDIMRWGGIKCRQLAFQIAGRDVVKEESELDIQLRGGVKADADVRDRADQFFNEYYERERFNIERPWNRWEETVIADIVDLVNINSGTVVFYHVPQNSRYINEIYGTEQRDKDRESFESFCKRNGCIVIKPDYDYDDSFFPDNFHLGVQESKDFTRALAEEFMIEVLDIDPEKPEGDSEKVSPATEETEES